MPAKKISVVIRTYNEAEKIGHCLAAIFSQKTPLPLEVVVVDSGSTDATCAIVKQFPVHLIQLPPEQFSYGRSLNVGCRASTGEFIVLLSAHAVPVGETWLETLVKNFDNPQVAGVYGQEIPETDCNPITKRLLLAHWKNKTQRVVQTTDATFKNPGSIIKKNVWQKIPFNQAVIASEDCLWAQAVQHAGYTIIYEPAAILVHSHNETVGQRYRRHYREMYMHNAISQRKMNWLKWLIHATHALYHNSKFIVANRYQPSWIFQAVLESALIVLVATNLALTGDYRDLKN